MQIKPNSLETDSVTCVPSQHYCSFVPLFLWQLLTFPFFPEAVSDVKKAMVCFRFEKLLNFREHALLQFAFHYSVQCWIDSAMLR